jgi:hypothetical protein
MDRRALLQGLLTLPMASALHGLQSQTSAQSQSSTQYHPANGTGPDTKSLAKLRIVLDGAFTVVVRADNFWNIEVFTPRHPSHQFRFFGNRIVKMYNADKHKHSFHPSHFALHQDGLKQNSVPPTVNPALCHFQAATDHWLRDKYAVTMSLPPTENITFIPPLSPSVFRKKRWKKDSTREEGACLTSNYVLEYEITNASKIKMAWQQGNNANQEFAPMACKELFERYLRECQGLREQNEKKPNSMLLPAQCSDTGSPQFEKKYGEFCQPNDLTFFFGVGLPPGSTDMEHAVNFFNQTLESFPDLKERFAIETVGNPGAGVCKSCDASEQVSLQPPHLVEASSVVDCHVAGMLATQPTS